MYGGINLIPLKSVSDAKSKELSKYNNLKNPMSRIITNILEFLKRTPIKWDEVPAFIECTNLLNDLLQTKEEPKEKVDI